MKTRLCIPLLLTIVLIVSISPASRAVSAQMSSAQMSAQATPQATVQPSAQPLLELLAFIPDSPVSRPSDGMIFSYADYRAAEKAANVSNPGTGAAFNAMTLEQRMPLIRAYNRITVGPAMDYFIINIKEMPQVVGFEWFATDEAVLFGAPPAQGLVYAGHYDADKIATALSARNFDKSTVGAVTLWSRFDDSSVHMESIDQGDPFGGPLGRAARIAVFPAGASGASYVANAVKTDLIKAIISTQDQSQKSLADSADFRTLTDSLLDTKAFPPTPIQAFFAGPEALRFAKAVRPMNPTLVPFGALPPYQLAAIADYQDGDSQVTGLALVYSDKATAQQASAELLTRITNFDKSSGWQAPAEAMDIFEENGMAVARIRVHYSPTAQTGVAPTASIFRRWIQAIYSRGFLPLADPNAKP